MLLRRFALAAFLAALILPLPTGAQNRPTFDNSPAGGGPGGGNAAQTVDPNHPLPVSTSAGSSTTPASAYQKFFGTTTWTATTVAQTGSSITLLAANASRTGVMVYNPSTNATAWINPSGGTAVAEQSIPVYPGTFVSLTGSVTPKTAITTIGTNTQSVYVWEGS